MTTGACTWKYYLLICQSVQKCLCILPTVCSALYDKKQEAVKDSTFMFYFCLKWKFKPRGSILMKNLLNCLSPGCQFRSTKRGDFSDYK